MPNQTAIRFGYPDTLIAGYDHWVVLLRKQQVTLGSLVLCSQSDAVSYSALPQEAFAEMAEVVRDIERVLSKAVENEKINYLMLMMSDPNVHYHVLPRYPESRSACGLTIADRGWPAAPDLKHVTELSSVESDALCAHLRSLW